MASGWSIEFQPVAYKEFRQLGDKVKVEAVRAIQDLAEDPFQRDQSSFAGFPMSTAYAAVETPTELCTEFQGSSAR
jgi:hypothetical protein